MTHRNDTAGTHVAKALSHLEAAKAARLALDDAYACQRQDRAEIADLHQQIGFGLKVAEVHALLALVPSSPVVRDERQAEVLDLNAERFGRGSLRRTSRGARSPALVTGFLIALTYVVQAGALLVGLGLLALVVKQQGQP